MSSFGRDGYLSFFFPGALLLTTLFTAIFSNISLIIDRNEGFLQSVLVSPLSQARLLFSKVLGGSLLGTLQATLLIPFFVMVDVPFTVSTVFGSILILFLSAFFITTLGLIFAWHISSVSGYHGVMNLVIMPLWLGSGSVFPLPQEGMLSFLGLVNPLSYALRALNILFSGETLMISLSTVLALGLFCFVCFCFCLVSCRRQY